MTGEHQVARTHKTRMRHLSAFAVLSVIPVPSTAAEYYKLEGVKRLDNNLYRSGKILIETRYCFHLTLGETAVLRYEGSGEFSGSVIIWEDNSTCEVRKVLAE